MNRTPRRIGTGTCFCGDERGVALLIALAVLVLMAILAVSFYSSESLEREGADNARYARSAESGCQGGLDWAIALIESDVAADGSLLPFDTDYDIWGPLARNASAGYNGDALLSTDQNDPKMPPFLPDSRARWIPIYDGTRQIGRWQGIIECENGKANVNVVGNPAGRQEDGISPAEIWLAEILTHIDGSLGNQQADEIINLRQGGEPGSGADDDGDGPLGAIGCDDDLNGTVDNAGEATNEPDEHDLHNLAGDDIVLNDLSTILLAPSIKSYKTSNPDKFNELLGYLTVNSETQNVYALELNADGSVKEWRRMLSLDPDNVTADKILTELQALEDAGRLPSDADLEQVAVNIVDQLDEDNEPTEFRGKYGVERTPYINEVESSPVRVPMGGGTFVSDYGEFIELINPYEGDDVTVTIRNVKQLLGARRDITVTVPAASGNNPGFYVIGDTSGIILDPNTGQSTKRNDLPPRAGSKTPDKGVDLNLDNSDKLTLDLEGGATIQVIEYASAGNDSSKTSQIDDPRTGDDESNWSDDDGTPGEENAAWDPGGSGDKDGSADLRDLFVVYDGPIGAVGQLGRVHTGEPWATVNLTGDDVSDWDNAYTEATWLNIYDAFTTAKDPTQLRYGLINVNTASEEVLSGLKGLNASSLYNATHPASGQGRVIESIGELGEFLNMGSGSTSWDKEKHLSDIANLVTVHSNVFRVTVRAQALGRQGEVDKRGERWLQASVLRTVDPSTGEPTVRVLSMRWLVVQ